MWAGSVRRAAFLLLTGVMVLVPSVGSRGMGTFVDPGRHVDCVALLCAPRALAALERGDRHALASLERRASSARPDPR